MIRTRPTDLTLRAQLAATRDADADTRFRALLTRQHVERVAPDLVAMIFGGSA